MAVRAIASLAVAGALAAGVFGLAELTQNRADPPAPDRVTELTLAVRTKSGYAPSRAASALWAACHHTIGGSDLDRPIAAAAGTQRFTLVLQPALGRNATKRFLGCLQDATIPGVLAGVVDRRDVPRD